MKSQQSSSLLKHLPRNLRRILRAGGLCPRRLSLLAGLDAAHVALILKGKRTNVGVLTVLALAEVAAVSLDWLLLGRGATPPDAQIRAAVVQAEQRAARRLAVAA